MVRYNMVLCHIKWLLDVSNVPSLGHFLLRLNLVPFLIFFFLVLSKFRTLYCNYWFFSNIILIFHIAI